MESYTNTVDTAPAMLAESCTIVHDGREFTAGGAVITPDYASGYLSSDCTTLTSWEGNPIGSARITATWSTPRSYVSSEMNQAECVINGVLYTGRTAGAGMLWRGRRKAN